MLSLLILQAIKTLQDLYFKVDVLVNFATFCDVMRSNFGETRKKHCTTTYFRSGDSIFFEDDTILKNLEENFLKLNQKITPKPMLGIIDLFPLVKHVQL